MAAERWEWYNGCSWWRLGIAGDQARHDAILSPTIAHDGHPNLCVSADNRTLIAAAPDLLAALESAPEPRQGCDDEPWGGCATAPQYIPHCRRCLYREWHEGPRTAALAKVRS